MEMTILHIYDENDSMAARYAAMLNAQFTTHTSHSSSLITTPLSPSPPHPSIIHLHGRAPFPLPPNVRLVFSPHGECPAPASQFPLTPYVAIARSPMERDQLLLQFPRVETILNPIITRATTPEACARQTLQVYERVMLTNVLELMAPQTRQTLAQILAAAVAGQSSPAICQTPDSSALDSCQRDAILLSVYARQENILSLVQEGMHLLHIRIPAFTSSPPEGYQPEGYEPPKPMPGSDITALLSDIKANGPTLLRLIETARTLYSDSLDEALLLSQLDRQSLRPLFASVLQLLSEQLLLTEGFMPCPPDDGRLTRQLRQQIERHGCI